MRNLTVSFGQHLARVDRAESLTWDRYAETLTAAPPVSEDKASRGWSLPGTFTGGWRDAEHLVHRDALTFDFDRIERRHVADIERALRSFEYVIYTTASHTPDKPRLRVVLPLTRPATPDEFCAVSRRIAADVGIELAARESHVPAQMMYLPTVRPGAVFKARRQRGTWLDVDATLARYLDWTDRGQWPRHAQGDSTRGPEAGMPPREKPGLVGEFCRAFSISEAIAHFELPYRHEHGNRWTYTRGSSKEGAVVYDEDTKLHSHHDSDPARGQCNAFDLVRLHLFGDLDRGAPHDADPKDLSSWKAMLGYLEDESEFAARRLADVAPDLPSLPPLTPAEEEAGRLLREQNPAAQRAAEAASTAREQAASLEGALARPLTDVLLHPTRTEWLPGLKDTLERKVIAVMAGPRGSYKSFVALHWTLTAVAAGAKAYVVSAEGGDFDRRARAWLHAHGEGLRLEELGLYVVERRLDLNSAEGLTAVIRDCKRLSVRPDLFVLDTFSKLSGGLEENDNTEVKQFVGRLDNALKRQGATVLLIAHTGHTEKGRPRGASAFGADTDAEYIVSRTEKMSCISVTRERFKSSPELPPLHYRAEVMPLGYADEDGAPVTSLALREGGTPGIRASVTFKPRGAVQTAAWGVCREYLALGPGEVEGLVAAIAAKLVPSEGRDRRALSARRALENFVAAGVLFVHNETEVSLTRAVEDDGEGGP